MGSVVLCYPLWFLYTLPTLNSPQMVPFQRVIPLLSQSWRIQRARFNSGLIPSLCSCEHLGYAFHIFERWFFHLFLNMNNNISSARLLCRFNNDILAEKFSLMFSPFLILVSPFYHWMYILFQLLHMLLFLPCLSR